MLWELGKDAFNEYSLLATIHETLYGAELPREMAADAQPMHRHLDIFGSQNRSHDSAME